MKKNNSKGFTLAELLVVVAIIAILIAIAIPVFTAQTEKAKQSADAANIRSAYAEAMVKALELTADGDTAPVTTTAVMQSNKWDRIAQDAKIGDKLIKDIDKEKGKTETITITVKDGVETIKAEPTGSTSGDAKTDDTTTETEEG